MCSCEFKVSLFHKGSFKIAKAVTQRTHPKKPLPPKIMESYDNLDSGISKLPRSFYFFLFHVYEYLPP